MPSFLKPVLIFLGSLSFVLGIIGAFLPVLPTTPFMILAAYLFSKSSPRLQQKILDIPGIGILVKDWRDKRVIRPRAKTLSVLTIFLVISSSIWRIHPNTPLTVMLIIIGFSVSAFILSQNSSQK